MKTDRQEIEAEVMKFFRNAKPETQERIFENLIFSLPFEALKDLYNAEVL